MKVLKYTASLLFLAAVTLAALYFPRLYFQKYQYETVIEEIEQPSYAEFGSSKANLWQVFKMLQDTSYAETDIYAHKSAQTEADREIETGYIKMVQRVFKKYIKLVEEGIKEEYYEGEQRVISEETIENDILRGWMEDWIIGEKNWQVDKVTLLNLANIFSGELINIQLYVISFEIPNNDIHMDICFSPDTEIFYSIYVMDERYFFEKGMDERPWNLYVYYKKNGEPEEILDKYWSELINTYAIGHELFVEFFKF